MKRGVASIFRKIGRGTVNLLVCLIIMVVPIFSFTQVGQVFFQHGSAEKQSASAIPVNVTKKAASPIQPSVGISDVSTTTQKQLVLLIQNSINVTHIVSANIQIDNVAQGIQ